MHYGWVIVGACLVVGVSGYGTYFSFTLFYAHLVAEFGWSHTVVSGAMAVGIVSYGLFSLPMGWSADRFGPRVTVVIGGLLFGGGTALGALVTEAWQLYVLYGLISAAGMGAAWSPLVATVSRWFETSRGLAVGITTLGGGSGVFFIAPLAETLIQQLGWRAAYLWLGVISGGLIIGAALLLTRDPANKGMVPHGAAPATDATTSAGRENNQPRNQFQADEPSRIARSGLFWRMILTFGLWWFAGAITFVQNAPYMLEKGFDATLAAVIVTGFGAGNCVGRVVMGIACDRLGALRAYQLAIIVATVGITGLTFSSDLVAALTVTFFLGFGIGGASTQITTLGIELYGTRSVGALMGAILALIAVFGAIGPVTAGVIHDVSLSYTPAYLLGAASLWLSLLLSVTLRR
jgi:MFS family permease